MCGHCGREATAFPKSIAYSILLTFLLHCQFQNFQTIMIFFKKISCKEAKRRPTQLLNPKYNHKKFYSDSMGVESDLIKGKQTVI